MAIVRMKKIREMNNEELRSRLAELRLELSKERASSEIGTLKNPGRVSELRRAIARLLTEQRKRGLS